MKSSELFWITNKTKGTTIPVIQWDLLKSKHYNSQNILQINLKSLRELLNMTEVITAKSLSLLNDFCTKIQKCRQPGNNYESGKMKLPRTYSVRENKLNPGLTFPKYSFPVFNWELKLAHSGYTKGHMRWIKLLDNN